MTSEISEYLHYAFFTSNSITKKLCFHSAIFFIVTLTLISTVQASSYALPVNLTNSTEIGATDVCISGDGSKIAFARNDGEDWEIYVITSDGSGLIQLTDNSVNDRDPSISADGSKVTFTHSSSGKRQICIINSDGSGFRELTDGTKDDVQVSISGDGSKIVFTRIVEKNVLLFVMNSDGTGLKQLTDSKGDYTPFVTNPSISDDGKKIAFQDSVAVGSNIFVVNSDGTGLTKLTTTSGDYSKNTSPSISGNGNKIAYTFTPSIMNENNSEVFLINVDGSGLTQLTSDCKGARYPFLNDDGSQIVFEQGFDNYTDVFIINSDGSGLTQITTNNYKDQYPSMSRNSDKIAFESNGDVFIVLYDSQENQPNETQKPGQTGESNGDITFPAERIIISLAAVAGIAGVLAAVYLKRKSHPS